VAAMEDVLDLYEEPYDPLRPVVCFDESPKQLIAGIRTPLSAKPGVSARYDTEYEPQESFFLHEAFPAEQPRNWLKSFFKRHQRRSSAKQSFVRQNKVME